jgi:hypothetical protein
VDLPAGRQVTAEAQRHRGLKKKRITTEAQSRKDAFGKAERVEVKEKEDYHRSTVPKGCLRQGTEG